MAPNETMREAGSYGQSEKLVELCITSLLTDQEWRMRAAAMRAPSAVPRKWAVPAQIDSIAVETGWLSDDAEQALFALTGRRFNGDAFVCKDGWSKTRTDSGSVGGPSRATLWPKARRTAKQCIPRRKSAGSTATRMRM